MLSQDKTPEGSPQSANPTSKPSLVDVARQLNSPGENPSSAKPEVVFVAARKPRRTVEVTVTPRLKAALSIAQQSSDSNLPQAPVEGAPVSEQPMPVAPQLETQYASPEPQVLNLLKRADSSEGNSKFAFDPFSLEIDGPIPAMPTLPIVDAIEMTQKVVSREKAGTHYAWRLEPGPYPDLGNSPQVDDAEESQSEVDAEPHSSDTQTEVASVANEILDKSAGDVGVEWSEMEVVSDGGFESLGDSFMVQAGEVIYIDGNQGYDHIDLRSYNIKDATFQPGAILLDSSDLTSVANENTPEPITIRHRGVAFAIFKGEIRVDL